MTETTRTRYERGDFIDDDSEETAGIPWDNFVTALQVWSWMRPGDKQATVREAADQFGTTDDVIRMAVKQHHWMFLDGPDDEPTKQFIDHEGE